MSQAINAKRQQFYLDIRKARTMIIQLEKQAIFRQARIKLIQNLNQDPIKNILSGYNVDSNIQALQQSIQVGENYQKILQMLDKGIIILLINFLKDGKYIQNVLKLIATIISKQKNKIGNIFVSRGLIELALNYLQNRQYTLFIVNIFGNLAIQDNNFAQLMLYNNIHQIIISEIIKIIQQNNQQNQRLLQFCIQSIVNMSAVKKSNLDLNNAFKDIQFFSNYLLQKQISVQNSLQLMYQISTKDKDLLKNERTITNINYLFQRITIDCKYLKNLLYLIYNLHPIKINYKPIYNIIISNPKNITLNLRILLNIIPHDQNIYLCDDVWWEKLLQFVQKGQDKINLLKIIQHINIFKQWVWRFLAEFIQPSKQPRQQIQGLLFIKDMLNKYKREQIIIFAQKHCIIHYLQLLSQSKNTTISSKSIQLYCQLCNH